MKYSSKIKELFNVIIEEAERNPDFKKNLENIIDSNYDNKTKKKNKRNPALVDPIKHIEEGRGKLINILDELNIEQLKDVVAEYGMDPKKLVMKWKDKNKIIEHIITLSEARFKKGDVFRKQILKYNKEVIENHTIFQKFQNQIEKDGMEQFLKDNGVYITVVPFYKHPSEGGTLIGYHIEVKYQFKKINDEEWEYMQLPDYTTYSTIEEATTSGIIKSFDIILQKKY